MYNKIAPIILNSGKANGLSDVFIAQPDSLKESLAGKIFIIAEISGKKTDGRKVLNFLISSLNDTYYNDEKILLRDKIEGLKIENIFEAALSKTNKNLSEFLVKEKIKLNIAAANLTIGVIYENKLYFSSFGKNRALLIYRHGEDYEIINVEANAADVNSESETKLSDKTAFKIPSVFSSVISGEIPTGSFFIFVSEALPEYISSKDLINIITKLPPIVAAEQIKNILAKINSFIPFLGIIIKNTIGLDNQEIRDEVEENLTAHSSISSLNYTEQKTERMLAPAGLISFSKIYKSLQRLVKSLRSKPNLSHKKVYRGELTEEKKMLETMPDLGKVKSLNADSFLIKEKIFFKKKPNWLDSVFKKFIFILPRIFSFRIFSGLGINFRSWSKGLNKKNRLLFMALAAVVVIFTISLVVTNWTRKQKAAKNNYNNLITTIEERQGAIDSYLLYDNEESAKNALIEARALLSYLPKVKKEQIAIYSNLENKLNLQADKIQRIVKIESIEKVNDLSGLGVKNIIWADGKIYAAGGSNIYSITPQSSSSTKFEVSGAINLNNPQFDGKSNIYYREGNKVVDLNLKTGKSNLNETINFTDGIGYRMYLNWLYVLVKEKNQIYRYGRTGSGNLLTWLKEDIDLSKVADFSISRDGKIYILDNSGLVSQFYANKKISNYITATILPVMTSANKIIIGDKHLYIFEASSKRLVVLNILDGRLLNQYQINPLKQPQDFSIDEANKSAYFLDGDMIYKITLNQ